MQNLRNRGGVRGEQHNPGVGAVSNWGDKNFLTLVVSSDEAQDVLVSQHHRLVNLSLAEPGALLTGGEDLHRHLLPTPFPPPNLPEAALPYAFLEDDGPGDGPLHQQRQSYSTTKQSSSDQEELS